MQKKLFSEIAIFKLAVQRLAVKRLAVQRLAEKISDVKTLIQRFNVSGFRHFPELEKRDHLAHPQTERQLIRLFISVVFVV